MELNERDKNRIIEMAWEDRTPFEAIEQQFQLNETAVISLMRSSLRAAGFRRWRRHVSGRKTKHQALRNFEEGRFKSKAQRNISFNRPSKPK